MRLLHHVHRCGEGSRDRRYHRAPGDRRSRDAEVRLYDRLFTHEDPASTENYLDHLNPSSLDVQRTAKVEPSLAAAPAGSRYQFERLGYFAVDPDSTPGSLVFNRTVSLRDAWARIAQKAHR